MPAYIVFSRDKTMDQQELDIYSSKVGDSFEGRNVKFMATYGAHHVLEGPAIEGAVILEFPSVEEARAWYESPQYQSAAIHRFKGASYRAFIIDGRL